MTNRLSLFVIVLMALVLTGCKKSPLKQQVEFLNRQCPLDLGVLGEVTSVDLDGQAIVYHVATNPRILKLDRLRDHVGDVKQGVLLYFANDTASLRQLVPTKCGLKYEYSDTESGERFVVDISNDDLRRVSALVGNQRELARRRIENFVATGRLQLPLQIDAITTLTDIALDADAVAYTYTIDEESVAPDDLEAELSSLRMNIRESLGGGDPSMGVLIDVLTRDHRGLVYRYVMSKSGKQFDITFTPDDVASIGSAAGPSAGEVVKEKES